MSLIELAAITFIILIALITIAREEFWEKNILRSLILLAVIIVGGYILYVGALSDPSYVYSR